MHVSKLDTGDVHGLWRERAALFVTLSPGQHGWRIVSVTSSWASYEAMEAVTGGTAFSADWRPWDESSPTGIADGTMWLGARPMLTGVACVPLLSGPGTGNEVNCIWDGLEITVVDGPIHGGDGATWWKLGSSNVGNGRGGWVSESNLEHLPRGSYRSGSPPWWEYLQPWEWPSP